MQVSQHNNSKGEKGLASETKLTDGHWPISTHKTYMAKQGSHWPDILSKQNYWWQNYSQVVYISEKCPAKYYHAWTYCPIQQIHNLIATSSLPLVTLAYSPVADAAKSML